MPSREWKTGALRHLDCLLISQAGLIDQEQLPQSAGPHVHDPRGEPRYEFEALAPSSRFLEDFERLLMAAETGQIYSKVAGCLQHRVQLMGFFGQLVCCSPSQRTLLVFAGQSVRKGEGGQLRRQVYGP